MQPNDDTLQPCPSGLNCLAGLPGSRISLARASTVDSKEVMMLVRSSVRSGTQTVKAALCWHPNGSGLRLQA